MSFATVLITRWLLFFGLANSHGHSRFVPHE
jgi:hypothetical protein